MSAGDKHGGDADGVGGDADGAMVTSSVSVSLKRDEEKGRKQVKEKFLEAVGITERSSSQPRRIIPRSGLAPTWPAWNFVLGGGGVAKNLKQKNKSNRVPGREEDRRDTEGPLGVLHVLHWSDFPLWPSLHARSKRRDTSGDNEATEDRRRAAEPNRAQEKSP